MHDRRALIEGRVRRLLADRVRPAATTTLGPLEVARAVPGHEPATAQQARHAAFQPIEVGEAWASQPWSTTWLRVRAQAPGQVHGRRLEAILDLGWAGGPGFAAEALGYAADGTVCKGLHPGSDWLPVHPDPDGTIEVYVEAAANPTLQLNVPTHLGDRPDAGTARTGQPEPGAEIGFRLRRAELVVVEEPVRDLVADLVALDGLAATLPDDSPRAWQVLRALGGALDALDLNDIPGTAAAARAVLAPVLQAPAAASAHRITAVGHAHIDTAWLWPMRETRRKVARTVANVLALIEDPAAAGFVFALPAAAHCAWLEQDHPQLFQQLQAAVAAGHVAPVGGMWVEPDANLTGAESVCRQLVLGSRFFRERFGVRCTQLWLPDSFGYSAALPQLAVLAGMPAMLTQKVSWNDTNRFPHHSFWWEGLDGTRVLTHFPPVDSYNSDLSGAQLAHAAGTFADQGRSNCSLVPFGYGDGGGGPTREMLAQAARVADLDGSPRVRLGSPTEFFATLHEQLAADPDPAVWVGELYLEKHRGTFTNQARTKAGNRRCEALLHEAELWSTTAAVRGLLDYPYQQLQQLWEQVLLGQFHDVLPGSSIAWVHDEIEEVHSTVAADLEELVARALGALLEVGDPEPEPPRWALAHPAPWVSEGLPMGASVVGGAPPQPVTAVATGNQAVLDNGLLRVVVDARGLITSFVDERAGRELIPPGQAGAVLHLHQDLPNEWDGWDLERHHLGSLREVTEVADVELTTDPDGVAVLRVHRRFGASRAVQTLALAPRSRVLRVGVEVDWHETDTLLKLAWPVDVHTDHARFETQFGHVRRHTHENTAWDHARFEVPAHRWLHVGEPGYGVAIANERTYGWDVRRAARPGGGSFSIVRASLLRGARFPDPRADAGVHRFGFLVQPGAGVADAIRLGYAATLPPRRIPLSDGASRGFDPLVRVAGPVVLETVKLAEDRSGDVVLRLYEPLGDQARAHLHTSFQIASAHLTDLHEDPLAESDPSVRAALPEPAADTGAGVGRRLAIRLRPFQVLTLRLRPMTGPPGAADQMPREPDTGGSPG